MTVCEKAYAKINLFLDVTGRREDGYHNINTLMQTISLCDEITLTVTPSDKIEITIVSDNKALDISENNLIYKSALKYMSYFNIVARVDVELIKRIPIGAGLGGGSSDAAATLRAMNRIYGLASKEQLLDMAGELGSDIPFCIEGGCALCTGRGEKVRPFDCRFNPFVVVAIGESRVSTPEAYSLLDEKYGNFESHNECKSFQEKGSIPIYNIFESVIGSAEIDEIKQILTENGAICTLMSGSGPAVFGGFSNCLGADCARKALEKRGFSAFKCRLR